MKLGKYSIAIATSLLLSACGANTQQDLTLAYGVAVAAESSYIANSKTSAANKQQVVALMAAAKAAFDTYQANPAGGNNAMIAAAAAVTAYIVANPSAL